MNDGIEARGELEHMKIRKALHPIREGVRTYLPPSIFFFTNEEKMSFCKVLSKVRVLDGYSTNLARCVNVNEKKIYGLNNHDHHGSACPTNLAIRRVLPKPITLVLPELSAIFRLLCRKKES
ncbi:hypothetical protein L3X38_033559 [Prunus dulcis]|uniref:Uncharacterized protein n=1 Tax=Prunus dulcis TaxID=3755 RepID=A0AAD4YWX7_PRUDU|nr:hypothetical protein L3X38_033559 [Prunus dulcis]